MSFLDFLADPDALRNRGECIAEFDITDPAGLPVTLRASRRGRHTGARSITLASGDTIPAQTKYDKRLLGFPTLTQSMWSGGAGESLAMFAGYSFPAHGHCLINNQDRSWDQYAPKLGYRWSNGAARVYCFDYRDPAGTIGKIFDGGIGTPDFSQSGDLPIPLMGRDSLFTAPLSERVYRGTGNMIEIGQGAKLLTYGASPAAVNITGDLTLERWVVIETANTAGLFPWFGWNGGSPWRVVLGATRTLGLFVSIGGITESRTSVATLAVGRPYHIAIKIQGRNVYFEIWDEDNQTLTTETYINAYSSAVRDAALPGIVYQDSTLADATLRYWLDDYRVWSVYRTPDEVRENRHRPLQSPYPATLAHYMKFDEPNTGGVVAFDSSATGANAAITGAGAHQWLASCEGGTELAGVPKPDIYGPKFGAKPYLVAPLQNIYQVAGGGRVKSIQSHEGGFPHTMAANAASWRALLTTTPAAANSLPYRERGLFRLPALAPAFPISCTVEGYDDHPSLGYVSTGTKIVRDIVTRRGPQLADPADLVTASFSSYPTEYTCGFFVQDTRKALINWALSHAMRASLGWWGYLRSETQFRVQRFISPVPGTPTYRFTERDIISITPRKHIPIYQVVVRYRHNDVVHQEEQIAAAVKAGDNWGIWKEPYSEKSATDQALRAEFPGDESISITLDVPLYLDEDAQAYADTALALVGGVREALDVNLRAVGLQCVLGETASLSFEYQDGTRVMSLDGTRNHVILATTDNRFADGSITITVLSGPY